MSPSPIRTALVTGATGFAGAPLCRELRSRGISVIGAARRLSEGPWDEFRVLDVTSEHLPDELMDGVDTVFHLAGRAHAMAEGPAAEQQHRLVNGEGTRKIVAGAREAGVFRFVFFSSVKAAGDSAYGLAKRLGEKFVLEHSPEMHAVVLRPALMYGRGWKGNLERMAELIRRGRFPPLPDLGNRRSMVHVDDVARAAVLVAEDPRALGATYVLTDGEGYSTRRIYEAICRALGREVPSWTVPIALVRLAAKAGDALKALGLPFPLDSQELARLTDSELYDSFSIRDELGWKPVHTLETAIDEILTV